MKLKRIVFFLLLSSVIQLQAEENCPAKIDAYVGSIEIYRTQIFDKSINKCIPANESYIIYKESEWKYAIPIDGFVVGVETFWNNKLGEIIKITSKAGGHTTLVKLLRQISGKNYVVEIPNGTFSSSMEYIVVSKDGPEEIKVKVRNNSFQNDCIIITEEIFDLKNGVFVSINNRTIEKECS